MRNTDSRRANGRRGATSRRTHIVGAALTLPLLAALPAAAVEFDLMEGKIKGHFDTTLSVGASARTQDRDADLIALGNGGTAASWNADNGNLNYDKGDLISGAAKALHELELQWGNYGLFGRVTYFYDPVISDHSTDRTELTHTARNISGHDFELLDLYADAKYDIGDRTVSVRIGNQVLNWGESTFIGNGIGIINPFDVAKLRVAGAELREAFLPVPIVDLKVGITQKLSIEGFYQAIWKNTELDPEGTFFSTSDSVGPGGSTVILGFGRTLGINSDNPPAGQVVPRSLDEKPSDQGQFGFALRYFEPALNDSEFGFYYIRHHSRLPLLSARTGTAAALGAGGLLGYIGSARYFREFPEDIDLFGASVSSEIGDTGIAIQGEVSYRNDQPLQIDDTEILFAALSPLPGTTFGANGQLGTFPINGAEVTGFRRKDVIQAQTTLTKNFGPNLGASQVIMLGEVGATYVRGMESKGVLRYEGPGTFSTGNPACVGGGAAAACGGAPYLQSDGFADQFSWGYRLLARGTYNNAIGPIALTPSVAFAHDVAGTTPAPLGNFVDGRKAVTLSVGASYQNAWRAELAYTNFFGGGPFNLLIDRDFVTFSLNYSF